jgi:hypothetical protein
MPYVTALYACVLALLLIALAVRVSRLRMKLGIGAGGDGRLARAIRVHANAVEWTLPMLLLLIVAELNRASPLLLHVCGVAFIVARVVHAIGLSRSAGSSTGRFSGTVVSWIVIVVLAVWDGAAFVRFALLRY